MNPTINHRLFTDNKSTPTTWMTGRGKSIPVSELAWEHLAAIVNQYEDEAVKFLRTSLSYSFERDAFLVQNFLTNHVPAWRNIKRREFDLKNSDFQFWHSLFVNKSYDKKSPHFIPKTKRASSTTFKGGSAGGGKTDQMSFDIETLIGKTISIPLSYAVTPPKDKPTTNQKNRVLLEVTKRKIAIINELNALKDFINKNL